MRGPGAGFRVIHVLAPAEVGGIETVVRRLAAEQGRAGYEVYVIPVITGGAQRHPFLQGWTGVSGVSVRPLVASPRRYGLERRTVTDLARAVDADIVHTHGYRPDVVHGALASAGSHRLASTVHGFTCATTRKWLYNRLQCLTLRRYDVVVAVAGHLRATLIGSGVDPRRIHEIPNVPGLTAPLPPARAARILRVPTADFRMVWIGRITREKGIDLVLEAVSRLDGADWSLTVMGSGGEERWARARALELGIAKRVRWLGAVPNAAMYLQAFDVLVLSSRTEGSPMVVLEALSAGIPVVAAAIGGVPSLVDAETGLVVPPGDPAALAAALDVVRLDPSSARLRASRARQRWSSPRKTQQWIRAYEDAYRAALGTSQPR
jgi:glycosyltransferase involved in cell wall biosynthesis